MSGRNSKIETRNSAQVGRSPRRPSVRDFTDLEVWKAARNLGAEIYRLAKLLPEHEKYGLASQLRRAAVSVTANIAEGFGRYTFQENAHACRQARGSLYELRDHLITCVDEGYLSPAEGEQLAAIAHRVGQLLNGYLRATLAWKSPAGNQRVTGSAPSRPST